MKSYEFRIGLCEGCQGIDIPAQEWEKNGLEYELSGTVVIIMDTEAWDEFPDDMPLVLGGNSRLYDLFLDWLDTSFDLRGKAISSALFSPRQLYEALIQGWPHGFAVDGELPPDGGGNRDEWLENRSEDDIFESAQVRTPTNIAENISRGREAMKHVIATGGKDYHAMYREELGWIAFSWGEPGTPPPDFQDKKEAAEWWAKLPGKTNGQKGSKVFAGGYGVSHIIAKRDWEAKWMNRFAGQSGKDVALMCVEVLARGTIISRRQKKIVTHGNLSVSLIADSRWVESKELRARGKKKEEYWLLTGFEVVEKDEEYGIFEAADEMGSSGHQSHPTHTMPTVTRHGVGAANPQISADEMGSRVHQSHPTHTMPTVTRHGVGAANSNGKIMPENSSIFNNKAEGQTMPGILEKASPVVHNVESEVRAATTFGQIADIFKRLFGTVLPPQNDAYKDEGSDYGLKVSGKKARERINAQCKAILERVQGNPELLTEEDRELLRQYSGRGGTSENSQYEYYTPKHVAEGVWDALKAHGFENGNVLDPCCGAGIFSGTKPEGVIVSGNDLDPVGSGVAALLNPEDRITTRPFEEVVVSTEDNTFDSAIGNVPFGSARGKSMHIDSAYKGEKKIERYFLLRALDKIKPGGLACFVCPTNIVGNKGRKWEEFRIALSKKAEFLGAHKLPSKTFSAQGTDTVVDIVVLRKHGADLLKRLQGDEIPSDALKAANVIWEEFVSGMYWQGEGRRFIMGTYTPKVPGERFSRETVDGDIDNASMKQKLAQKFSSRINWELLNAAEPVLRAYTDGDRRYINGDPYEYRNGEWIKVEAVARETSIDASRFGASSVEELSSLLKDPAGALELTVDNAFSVYKAYPELLSQQQKNAVEFAMAQGRDEAREQVYRGSILGAMLVKLGADEEGGEDVSSRRQALQEAIVSEIEKYGHPANNPKLTLTGQSSRAFGAFMNSIDTQGNFSALLAGTLDKATAKGYVEDNLADIVVHLQKLQGDQIELEDVKALYKGAAPLESLGDLAGIEGIAITPDGMLQPAARYCAGDVVSKMAALADAIGKTEDERLKSQFQKQIEEMNRKIQRVGVEDITFGLQNNWFSKKYIVEFLRENGYPDAVYGEYRDVEYEEDDGSITQRNRFVEDMDSVNGHFHLYGAGSRKPELFPGQFEKYLNGDRITSTDKEKIQAYKEEASRLEAAFDSWMKQHLDVDELTEQYNLKFNGHVPVEYDSTPLDIDDIISGEIKPHTYQCAEVRRLSEQGAGICGFGTGLGKSFTALAMAGYNYKHGRAKRTCVVVPSAVLENWYHESRIFYSEGYMRSNVLFVGLEPKVDQDGNIERRPILDEKGEAKIGKDGKPLMQDVIRFLKGKEDVYEAMWKIPQSNYSLVVMTKEKFQSIPIKPSTMKEYTDDMVKRHLMSEKEAASIADAAAKKRRSYQEDVHQAQLEGRFSDERTEKKGELPYLEDMGFDSIITDESHFFKNSLSGGDKTKGIVYVPNPKTSNIAVDMAIKSSWLRRKNNGRGIYGLTATPVTNSPVEIYNMLNLVAPKEEFESMGIHTVDDFVRFFGDIQQRMRSAVSGEIVNSDTLVGFKNLSGLRNLFRKYVNIKTVKDVDDEIHVPYAVEMEEEVDMTEEQALAYEGLRARAKEASKNRGANKGSDSIFSIMRDMDRCTTDMDLFKRQMTFILPREHKAKMAGLLPKLPTEFTIVEEDEVTGEKVTYRFDFEPKLIDNGGDSFSVIVHEQHEAAVLKAIREYGIPENEATHPLTPKYAKMVENLKKHLDAGGKQIVFTEEKSQHQKIKRLLVHNLPITEDQIAIINAEEASGDKLDKISKAYNAGSVKIVIANKKAEVGVNLQKGTTAIHHLTLPWTPASISQRNGRGVRQGNKVDSVDVYYYYGKGTFDSYRKQLLQAKAGWIGELLMGKESRAENADVAADEEMMAALTGTLEEYRAQKAAEEERRKNAAKAQLVNRLRQLTSIHSSLATLEGRRTKAKEDADYEVQAQERRIRKYEQENKGEEVLRKAQEKLEKLKAKAASVDGKYDAEKKKSEAQRNMITGMLRQAGKDGSLPFDVSLIDHPENCLVSLDGEMYAIGEFLEFAEEENSNYYGRNPSGVCRITGLDQADRTLRLENVMTGSTYRVNTKKLSSYAKKVSYSASELAMKRLLAGNMSYEALHGSGLTMQQFMENAGSVTIYGGAFVEDSTGKMTLIRWESEKSEDLSFVWPEPDNEDFRKRAMIAYLDAIKTVSAYSDPFMTVMTSLFGEEYRAEAEKYANNATPAEMHTILARAWETYTDGKLDTPEAKIAFSATWQSEGYNSILGIAIKAFKQDGYDNLIEMRGLSKAYLSCKYQEVLKMAEDAEREIRRQHDEELRKHPDFKEISSEWRDKFRTLGLDICYNTEDANLKFKRKVQKFGPYSRLFLCDSRGIGGILYRLKEMMKKRFDADFTKDWHEKAGAWWHVPATVDLEELYDFFA